jgi:hypothetical protein
MIEVLSGRKSNYFRFAIAIASIPIIDAPAVTTGEKDA